MTKHERIFEMVRERYLRTFDQEDYELMQYLLEFDGFRITNEQIEDLRKVAETLKDVRMGGDWDVFSEIWKVEEQLEALLEALEEAVP